MGRNGALGIEEWRPRWPPLWVHSTNLLNLPLIERIPLFPNLFGHILIVTDRK
jgi:hypothetical protein